MYNILCVDDTEANLFVLESLFETKKEDFNLILVNSGIQALKILLQESIDLILLDVMMPELNGFETAQLIESNKKTIEIPIIFLTAKKDKETIREAFKYGVDYLSKPFDEDELFSRVKSHLEFITLRKKLEKQITFNQSVLDCQQNIIFIHDDTKLLNVNKSFYSFFNVKSIEEFTCTYGTISSQFMEYESYFSLNGLNNSTPWLSELSSKEHTQYSILLLNHNTFEPETFVIEVNPIENSEKFVVTLTNITTITTRSKKYEMRATYDVLTNIYNRSKFNECIDEQHKLFTRYDGNLCFAIFDIDFFKQVNDIYGHVIGDKTLIIFAQTIEEQIRNTDVFARWGGEEFTLLMPHTKIDDAYFVVEKLRKLIENIDFKTVGQKTCSIGLTQFMQGDTVDSVLVRADEALYEAKESGRNKVCIK